MPLEWHGDRIKRRMTAAQESAVNATMQAAILHAKDNHGAGAHAARRFISRTGELERSIRIVQPARPKGRGVEGRWGSKGLIYARRIELGFQGKDAAGRVVDAPSYPYLIPAADAEYPKLGGRVARAFRRAA